MRRAWRRDVRARHLWPALREKARAAPADPPVAPKKAIVGRVVLDILSEEEVFEVMVVVVEFQYGNW